MRQMSSCWLLSAALLQSLLLAVGGFPQQQQQQDSSSRLSPSLDSFRTSCGIASTQQRRESSSSSNNNNNNSTSSLFPWLVGISTSSSSLSCTGAFVSPNVVAAPAHCVAGRSAEDVKVEIISR